MEIKTIIENDIQIFELKGNLLGEVDGRPMMIEYSKALDAGCYKLIFNLEQVKFINSVGLGSILNLINKSKEKGAKIIFTNLPPQLTKIIAITKLESVLVSADSVESARKII
jgi:anti-sigma B factor antagonist